jgi:hypothetical protein
LIYFQNHGISSKLKSVKGLLSECKDEGYIEAAGSKDEFFSVESLFLVLVLQQQMTINELIKKISERKKRSSDKLTEWMDGHSVVLRPWLKLID